MKAFFKNKENILLITLLLAILGVIGFLGYRLYLSKNLIIVPDFSNSNVNEVQKWCDENNLKDVCIISYEFDDEVNENGVLYQSVKANEKLSGNINVIISKGRDINIQVPKVDKDTTKDAIALWVSDNKLTNVNYIYEKNDDIEKDIVFKITPDTITSYDTKITIYISLGSQDDYDDFDYITVEEDAYLGLSLDEFKSKVEALGLNVGDHVAEYDDFSDSYEINTIIWHGSGYQYVEQEGVRYALSLGKGITIDSTKYLGLTEDEFVNKIKEDYGLDAQTDGDNDKYSNYDEGLIRWYKSDVTYKKGDIVYYSISKGKKITLSDTTYLGKTESDFVAAMNELGLVAENDGDDRMSDYDSGTIRWYKSDESYVAGDVVKYSLSSGKYKYSTIKSTDYTNKTESELSSSLSNLGLSLGTKSEDYSDSVSSGNVISVSAGNYKTGESVNYVVSKGSKPVVKEYVQIMATSKYQGQESNSYEQTVNNFKALDTFKKLGNNVSYIGCKGDSVGNIVKIEVNGSKDYKPGQYEIGLTTVTIYICNEVDQ